MNIQQCIEYCRLALHDLRLVEQELKDAGPTVWEEMKTEHVGTTRNIADALLILIALYWRVRSLHLLRELMSQN